MVVLSLMRALSIHHRPWDNLSSSILEVFDSLVDVFYYVYRWAFGVRIVGTTW